VSSTSSVREDRRQPPAPGTEPAHWLTASSLVLLVALGINAIGGAFDRRNPHSSATPQVTLEYFTHHHLAGWINVVTSAVAMIALVVFTIVLAKVFIRLSAQASRLWELLVGILVVGAIASIILSGIRMAYTIIGLLAARTAQDLGSGANTASQAATTHSANHFVNVTSHLDIITLGVVIGSVYVLALTRRGLSVFMRAGYFFLTPALVFSTVLWGSFGFGLWAAATGVWLAHARLHPSRRPLIA
jgi:hypothetical protein